MSKSYFTLNIKKIISKIFVYRKWCLILGPLTLLYRFMNITMQNKNVGYTKFLSFIYTIEIIFYLV